MNSTSAKPSSATTATLDAPAGLPSAWAQAYPRGVALGGGGALVPAATLRVMLRPGRRLPMRHIGHAMVPWIGHGEEVEVEAGSVARPGDVALCQAGRWAELRRVLATAPHGSVITALDALPAAHEEIPAEGVLGVVRGARGAGDGVGRLVAASHPLWSRLAAALYWWKKVQAAPLAGDDRTAGIRRKYSWQVEGYETILVVPLGQWTLDLVMRHVPRGGALLVPGSGAGREALHLARAGYRVVGVDLVPEMVESATRHAAAEGLDATFLCGDIATLDLGDRRFDGAYITPLVYSFIPGRARRVACLRRLGGQMMPRGAVVYSAHLTRGWDHWARLCAVALRRRWRGDRESEFGDWITWFLSPEGEIETSYSHRFRTVDVLREAALAGFGRVEAVGDAHFVAREFHP